MNKGAPPPPPSLQTPGIQDSEVPPPVPPRDDEGFADPEPLPERDDAHLWTPRTKALLGGVGVRVLLA